MDIVDLLLILSLVCLSIYYFLVQPYDFWRNRGVKGPRPELLFGNTKDLLFRRVNLADFLQKVCQKFHDEPMIGIYTRRTPILVLNDPELIKDVLIRNFPTFGHRGLTLYEAVEPLYQNLFFLETARWRPLRQKLSPTFALGKIKGMFYLLRECADQLEKSLERRVKDEQVIECNDLAARFTTDVIGVCAFGLNASAIAEENSEFRMIGKAIFNRSTFKFVRSRIRESVPWLFRLLGSLFYNREVNDFFIRLIRRTIEYRKSNNLRRGDFVDLMVEVRDNPDKDNDIGKKINLHYSFDGIHLKLFA